MAVEVHRMNLAAVVVDVDHNDIALAYHVHRKVRVQAAVDRPPHPRAALDEAGSAADPVVESAGGVSWVEVDGGWCAVRQQVELVGGLGRHRYIGARRPDDDRGGLGQL